MDSQFGHFTCTSEIHGSYFINLFMAGRSVILMAFQGNQLIVQTKVGVIVFANSCIDTSPMWIVNSAISPIHSRSMEANSSAHLGALISNIKRCWRKTIWVVRSVSRFGRPMHGALCVTLGEADGYVLLTSVGVFLL